MSELDRVLTELGRAAARQPFVEAPEIRNVYYAVWVDEAGAAELSAAAPEHIGAGIVYIGECIEQTVRRHLAHRQIGSLTLMKNLAAVFRTSWRLSATNRGAKLQEPGLTRLRDWMSEHLTATVAARHPDVRTKDVLAAIEPPLRIEGWRPERGPLKVFLTEQRAELSR